MNQGKKLQKSGRERPIFFFKLYIYLPVCLLQETLLTIAQWVTEFWWAVLLMGIAFVIFMAIFIRCFAIHTPSSNPNLPKNLHFTETLRRPVRSLQHKVNWLTVNLLCLRQLPSGSATLLYKNLKTEKLVKMSRTDLISALLLPSKWPPWPRLIT